MNTIELSKANGSWIVTFTSGALRDSVIRLFGSPVVSTAFTDQADSAVVLARIRELNRGCEVTLA